MKIGILTVHSQLNYGGVLQCWALQSALEKMGYEVVVIDRWLSADNFLLNQGYGKFGFKQWARFCIRSLLGLGDINHWLRARRTKKFIKSRLNLTPYHFVEWKDAPKDLGVDMLVVGSDQLWHCGDWGDPRVYLLENAPHIKAITYAVSFGITEVPEQFVGLFRRGLARFSAISCRELEGVDICEKLGYIAAHVVDPTLLAWGSNAGGYLHGIKKNELVCYFLSESIDYCFPVLEAFAKRSQCTIKVFVNEEYRTPFSSNCSYAKVVLKAWRMRAWSHCKIMDGAGPEEFLKSFQTAKWMVSDSFHALMFSICNGCNARLIKPVSTNRQMMFSRILEFAEHVRGSLIVDSVAAALDSFEKDGSAEYDYDWVAARCRESEAWLKANLK